jgi:hypothetical protein
MYTKFNKARKCWALKFTVYITVLTSGTEFQQNIHPHIWNHWRLWQRKYLLTLPQMLRPKEKRISGRILWTRWWSRWNAHSVRMYDILVGPSGGVRVNIFPVLVPGRAKYLTTDPELKVNERTDATVQRNITNCNFTFCFTRMRKLVSSLSVATWHYVQNSAERNTLVALIISMAVSKRNRSEFRFPPKSKWGLRSSGILCSVDW